MCAWRSSGRCNDSMVGRLVANQALTESSRAAEAFYSVDRKHFAVLDKKQVKRAKRRYSHTTDANAAAQNDFESDESTLSNEDEPEAEDDQNDSDADEMTRGAYMDRPIRYHYIHQSAVHMYASVVEALDIQPGNTVLNCGSGSGYLSCIMACLAGETGWCHGVELNRQAVIHSRMRYKQWVEQLAKERDAYDQRQAAAKAHNGFNEQQDDDDDVTTPAKRHRSTSIATTASPASRSSALSTPQQRRVSSSSSSTAVSPLQTATGEMTLGSARTEQQPRADAAGGANATLTLLNRLLGGRLQALAPDVHTQAARDDSDSDEDNVDETAMQSMVAVSESSDDEVHAADEDETTATTQAAQGTRRRRRVVHPLTMLTELFGIAPEALGHLTAESDPPPQPRPQFRPPTPAVTTFTQADCFNLNARDERMRFDRIYVGAGAEGSSLPYFCQFVSVGGMLVGPFSDQLLKVTRLTDRMTTEQELAAAAQTMQTKPLPTYSSRSRFSGPGWSPSRPTVNRGTLEHFGQPHIIAYQHHSLLDTCTDFSHSSSRPSQLHLHLHNTQTGVIQRYVSTTMSSVSFAPLAMKDHSDADARRALNSVSLPMQVLEPQLESLYPSTFQHAIKAILMLQARPEHMHDMVTDGAQTDEPYCSAHCTNPFSKLPVSLCLNILQFCSKPWFESPPSVDTAAQRQQVQQFCNELQSAFVVLNARVARWSADDDHSQHYLTMLQQFQDRDVDPLPEADELQPVYQLLARIYIRITEELIKDNDEDNQQSAVRYATGAIQLVKRLPHTDDARNNVGGNPNKALMQQAYRTSCRAYLHANQPARALEDASDLSKIEHDQVAADLLAEVSKQLTQQREAGQRRRRAQAARHRESGSRTDPENGNSDTADSPPLTSLNAPSQSRPADMMRGDADADEESSQSSDGDGYIS